MRNLAWDSFLFLITNRRPVLHRFECSLLGIVLNSFIVSSPSQAEFLSCTFTKRTPPDSHRPCKLPKQYGDRQTVVFNSKQHPQEAEQKSSGTFISDGPHIADRPSVQQEEEARGLRLRGVGFTRKRGHPVGTDSHRLRSGTTLIT